MLLAPFSFFATTMDSDNPQKADLISYWSFDTDGADIHGTNSWTNDGAAFVPGKIGNAAEFAGTDFMRALDTDQNFPTGDVDWTFFFWVQPYSLAAGMEVISLLGAANQNSWSAFYVDTDSRFSFRSSTDGATLINENADVLGATDTDSWYMLFFGYKAAEDVAWISANDGIADERGSVTGGLFDVSQPYYLGANYVGAHWSGLIDEGGCYSKYLTSDERTWMFNSGDGRAYTDL